IYDCLYFIRKTSYDSTFIPQPSYIICAKSVDSAHRLSELIRIFENSEYSSDLSQEERKNILNKFKHGEIQLLICSDLIARGIDIDHVDTVINYDVPIYMKKYVHCVGRTARAR
ncbi:17977_t:CDS:2, partial [Dentiscutata erythropus]